jgi:hypothetical protein
MKKWTAGDDALLAELVFQKGTAWATIAPRFDGRSEDSVRHRWMRVYGYCSRKYTCAPTSRVGVKKWSLSEDDLLLTLVLRSVGAVRWEELAPLFQGRTRQGLRNRFCRLVRSTSFH